MRYLCNQCEHVATRAGNQKKHIKKNMYAATTDSDRKHEEVRYLCEQCVYTASTASRLKKHID